jgi:hypothetical protein
VVLLRLSLAAGCPLRPGQDRWEQVVAERGLHEARRWGGLMPRGMVALLAAVAAGLPVIAALVHGPLVWISAGDVAGAAGLVTYVTVAPRIQGSSKKIQLRLL